ncbi:MAG: diguanylate cyclase [Pseudomonadota bacterium]
MGQFSQLLVTFLNPIILIMALVLALSIVSRQRKDELNIDILMGGVFSLAVIHTMADPIALANGGQYDMRGLLIGVAAAVFGPKTGLIVVATGLSYRWGIGNPGLLPGFVHIGIAFAAGLIWWRFARNLDWPELVQSVALGVLLTSVLAAIFFAPREMKWQLFMMLFPYTLVCNVMGVVCIRYLLKTELSFLDSRAGLERAATTDHLTGLLNRRSLEARFSELSQNERLRNGMTALYFDIDRFKRINDTYGHAAGDAVLQVVSSRLASTFRSEDVFSRIGGDEFVVILPDLNETETRLVAERCRKTIAEAPIITGHHEIHATISVGAVWSDEVGDFQHLLRLADVALYTAKANGRNAVAFQDVSTADPSSGPAAVA